MINLIHVKHFQVGLRFANERLVGICEPGWYLAKTWFGERIDVLSEKNLFVAHGELDEIVRSGLLDPYVQVVDLKDDERALLWVDGRFETVLGPGRQAIWKRCREVVIERVSAQSPEFAHPHLNAILNAPKTSEFLRVLVVEPGETVLYYRDGVFVKELGPGTHTFWNRVGTLKFVRLDLREKLLDVSGQEIMTQDKVSLRVNALVTYKIINPLVSVTLTETADQALYRESQLALRAAIGARKLDELLAEKNALAGVICAVLSAKAAIWGLGVQSFGVRDLILPGDIRELMNRVVAAQKEAEANQIARREETAAMRSQCNTAKILEQNPTLMRLRELEVLERIATGSKLNLIVGEKGLTEKITNLL
jgi:regulator of protease activity HflC (stomatin/prohibitin superfamily)